MTAEWIREEENDNYNKKYKRETLLNYALNRWGLNKAYSVGPTSELIRACAPKQYEEWQKYYFENATQKKANGIRITLEYITDLGRTLYIKLSEVVQCELESITEKECIDYVYNLVINRTYEGYTAEIQTIYGQLQRELDVTIEAAPDEWDRTYNVDFFIKVNTKYIGLQIKPIATGKSLNDYQWESMHSTNHERFAEQYAGKVFFIYSQGSGKNKEIFNITVIKEIKQEISRLQSL